MFQFKTTLSHDGGPVTGIVLTRLDVTRLLAGMGAMLDARAGYHGGGRLVILVADDGDEARALVAKVSGVPFSDHDAALDRVGLWSCGHEAGHCCAQCFHELAGKTARLLESLDDALDKPAGERPDAARLVAAAFRLATTKPTKQ